jgi:hypothetical protein
VSLKIAESEVRGALVYVPSAHGVPLFDVASTGDDGSRDECVVHIERALRKRSSVADLLADKGYRDALPTKMNLRLSSEYEQRNPGMTAFRVSLVRLLLTVGSAVSLGLATAAAAGVVALLGSDNSEGLGTLSAIMLICVVIAGILFWLSNKKHVAARSHEVYIPRLRHA